jgi:lipopolysaccharide biosynthesis glycosyltransferase
MKVVFTTDARYELSLVVAVHSLMIAHGKRPGLEVHVYHTGVSSRAAAWLERHCGANGVSLFMNERGPDASFANLGGHLSGAAMIRLLLPQLMPTTVERVIYLDTDVLVRDRLDSVWEADLGENSTGAVQNYLFPTFEAASLQRSERRDLGLEGDIPYFNSGVLVMDLRRWREERIGERTIEYFLKHRPILPMPDQDSLNLILGGSWHPLDLRWNMQLYALRRAETLGEQFHVDLVKRRDDLISRPGIVHFTGSGKPWEWKDFRNPFRPMFRRMLASSGYLTLQERGVRVLGASVPVTQRVASLCTRKLLGPTYGRSTDAG